MVPYRRLRCLICLFAGAAVVSGCGEKEIPPYSWSSSSPNASSLQDYTSSSIDEAKRTFNSGIKTSFSLPSREPPRRSDHIRFTGFAPIVLNVAHVEVVDEYQSPMHEPNVEHLLPISPEESVHTWVDDRLHFTGQDKNLKVIIRDASIISMPVTLPDDDKTGPSRRYDARLVVEMRIYGKGSAPEAMLSITSTQSALIAEQATIPQRRAAFHQMMMALMANANAQLEKEIFAHFGPYINRAKTP